ncbi:MAG: hypothetical protein ABSD73_01795 [Candidatus Bathyarchaeia archaeon]|jgi:hypothetical protein
MPARKMRVELFDSEGNRYSISFEGQVTRDKAVRLLDLVELLGGVPGDGGNPGSNSTLAREPSKYDKVRATVQKHFTLVWFSSREVQTIFEQEFREPIGLSTVATYLARMAGKKLLLRAGPSNSLRYKVATSVAQVAAKVTDITVKQ